MPAARVRRRGIHSEVVSELGSRIVRGDYPTGAVLPGAHELAVELGVSRTVIREVTRVLAEKGMVESRQRIGTRVRERQDWDLVDPEVISWQRTAGPDMRFFRDLSEVRMAIEATAARLAAARATTAQVEEMRVAYAQMERWVDDPAAYVQADLLLHGAILRAADNALLTQLEHTISQALVASRDVTVRAPEASVRALPLHLAVIDAIGDRDPQASAARMTELLERALSDIVAILGAGDSVDGQAGRPAIPAPVTKAG